MGELKDWLIYKFFKGLTVLIKEEVIFKVSDFNLNADLIAIQSKSNVIHGFEIKTQLKPESVLSSIWQANSYYTNYKWLVILENDKNLFSPKIISEKIFGVGVILYNDDTKSFKVWKQAKYSDGNFLKFIPQLEQWWSTTLKSEKR